MKKLLSCIFVCLFFALAPLSAWSAPAGHPPRVVDEADLLDESEQAELEAELNKLSEQHGCDLVVVTVDSIGYKSPMEFADDYFDYNGYGLGSDSSGALLLISMEDRDWWISTRGFGIEAFTDWGIEYIGEQIVDDLGNEEYLSAFMTFAGLSDKFLLQAQSGSAYDVNNKYESPKSFIDYVLFVAVSFIIALVLAFVILSAMKSQLKSVKKQDAANSYVRPGSMNVSLSREMFLYNTVSRTRISSESSSGGGSSTHIGSSGASHGGGGGKF